MPILIKSSKGQRSCQLLNNGTPKQTNTIDDIIEALKGLTFKFEIKITDITLPDDVDLPRAQPNPVDESGPQPNKVDAPKPQQILVDAPKPQPNPVNALKPQLNQVDAPRPQPILVDTPRPQPILVDTPRPQPILADAPKPQPNPLNVLRPPPNPVNVLRPQPNPVVSLKPKPAIVDAPKPKPRLVRGELKIGDIKTSCCIAVDDKSSPPIAYIAYDDSKLYDLVKSIDQIAGDIETAPQLTALNVGDIVFAKSIDDNKWYRSIVEAIVGASIHIYFFDWGLREVLTISRIRHLFYTELGLSKYPACALKLRFTKTPAELLEQVLSCETAFRMHIELYDNSSECYEVSVLDLVNN